MQGKLQEIGRIRGEMTALGRLSAVLTSTGRMSGSLSGQKKINGALSGLGGISAELSLPKGKASSPFSGPYTYTPTQQEQTIPIDGLRAIRNITIEPIPENYGLITWNGSTLTVS